MVSPGKVSALACTRDGQFCAAGIAEVLHVWQTCTGFLLATVKGHYQPISCMKFTDDGALLVTGGEDGQILVWDMSSLVDKDTMNDGNTGEGAVPKYTFNSHSITVRDLAIDSGGVQTLLASVSTDKNCKIFSLVSGLELLTLVFPVGLTSVALNSVSTVVFVGASDGKIYSYNLHKAPRTPEFHIPPEYPGVFIGHENAVVCLSVSTDGKLLISGSLDEKAIIWNIPSRQMLRTLPHKGAVMNAFFTIAPKNVFSEDLKPTILLKSFLRHTGAEDKAVERLSRGNYIKDEEGVQLEKMLEIQKCGGLPKLGKSSDSHDTTNDAELLKKVNHDLYHFAMTQLLKPSQSVNTTEEQQSEPNNTLAKKQKKKRKSIAT